MALLYRLGGRQSAQLTNSEDPLRANETAKICQAEIWFCLYVEPQENPSIILFSGSLVSRVSHDLLHWFAELYPCVPQEIKRSTL